MDRAEIKNFDPSIFGDEKIFRFEIAVDDSLIVRSGKTAGNLHPVFQRPSNGEPATTQALTQGLSFQQLRDNIGLPVASTNIKNRLNVRMI